MNSDSAEMAVGPEMGSWEALGLPLGSTFEVVRLSVELQGKLFLLWSVCSFICEIFCWIWTKTFEAEIYFYLFDLNLKDEPRK